jgi:hypothetical protein
VGGGCDLVGAFAAATVTYRISNREKDAEQYDGKKEELAVAEDQFKILFFIYGHIPPRSNFSILAIPCSLKKGFAEE